MKLNQICIFHNCNLELNCKYKEYYHPQFDLQTFLLSEKKICLQCFQLRVFSQKSFWRTYQHLLGRNHRVLKYEVKFILPLKLLILEYTIKRMKSQNLPQAYLLNYYQVNHMRSLVPYQQHFPQYLQLQMEKIKVSNYLLQKYVL